MKCDCFDKTIELVKGTLEGKKELEVKWQNRIFFFGKEDNAPCVLKIESEYRQTKTNGMPYKNKTKDTFNVVMKYCPLCGTKINPNKKDD